MLTATHLPLSFKAVCMRRQSSNDIFIFFSLEVEVSSDFSLPAETMVSFWNMKDWERVLFENMCSKYSGIVPT